MITSKSFYLTIFVILLFTSKTFSMHHNAPHTISSGGFLSAIWELNFPLIKHYLEEDKMLVYATDDCGRTALHLLAKPLSYTFLSDETHINLNHQQTMRCIKASPQEIAVRLDIVRFLFETIRTIVPQELGLHAMQIYINTTNKWGSTAEETALNYSFTEFSNMLSTHMVD